MTVYVDDMRRPARVATITARWSHLLADSSDELHAFAAQLGLRRSWAQHEGTVLEHYDVTDAKRRAALAAGATAITYHHGVGQLIERKRKRAQGTAR